MRLLTLLSLLVLLNLGAAHADPLPTSMDQGQQSPAGKFVQNIGAQAMAVMSDKSLSQEKRTQKYDAILNEAFDLKTIGHFVLGRTWNAATPQQQQDFQQLFEKLVLKTYGDRLSFYSGEGFHIKSSHAESDRDSLVSSDVIHPNGTPPTTIDWRVRQTNGKYAIIDVVIEGISQSVTQRQEYASILQRNNGDIEALLTIMRQRLNNLGSTNTL